MNYIRDFTFHLRSRGAGVFAGRLGRGARGGAMKFGGTSIWMDMIIDQYLEGGRQLKFCTLRNLSSRDNLMRFAPIQGRSARLRSTLNCRYLNKTVCPDKSLKIRTNSAFTAHGELFIKSESRSAAGKSRFYRATVRPINRLAQAFNISSTV